jgi:hypothetical protein
MNYQALAAQFTPAEVDHLRVLLCRLDVALLKFDMPTICTQEKSDNLRAKRRRISAAWSAKYPGARTAIENALIRTGYVG